MKIRSLGHVISQMAVTCVVSFLDLSEQLSLAYSIKSVSPQKLSSGPYRATVIKPIQDAGDSWDERIAFHCSLQHDANNQK